MATLFDVARAVVQIASDDAAAVLKPTLLEFRIQQGYKAAGAHTARVHITNPTEKKNWVNWI